MGRTAHERDVQATRPAGPRLARAVHRDRQRRADVAHARVREPAEPVPSRELALPAAALTELRELAALGYVRGVIERLDRLAGEMSHIVSTYKL